MLGLAGLSKDFGQNPNQADRLLGSGGCCSSVETYDKHTRSLSSTRIERIQTLQHYGRCYCKSTRQAYALKTFDDVHMLIMTNEARALRMVTEARIPRTVKLVRVYQEAKEGWIVTR